MSDTSKGLVAVPAGDRIAPVCRHFGTCGGCTAQHLRPEAYATWKRGLVIAALARHGLAPEVAALLTVAPGSRRRATLTAVREGRAVRLGYHARRSHNMVAIAECPVLAPAIVRRLAGLAEIAGRLLGPKGEARLVVTETTRGIDLVVESGAGRLGAAERGMLAALAERHGLVRIVVAGEEIARHGAPELQLGGVAVEPPPGAFVQAVPAAEAAMVALAVEAVGKARTVADLFCGAGTFTFALAARARILAIDSHKGSLAALATAARHARGLKPIETRLRDLAREPLSAKELQPFDAVVIDPPRAGAEAQCRSLARSRVGIVVAVSCNPQTLARDLSLLADGGYAIDRVTPIDQFLWSDHVEAVAVLRRS